MKSKSLKEINKKIKDTTKKMDKDSQPFRKRYEQHFELMLLKPGIKEEIDDIRKYCDIPPEGFADNQYNDFLVWLKKQKAENYDRISAIFEGLKLIKLKPNTFLDKLCFSIFETGESYPAELYFMESLEVFHLLLKEKPAPGMLHFILWNKPFIPESNQLQLSVEEVDKKYYPVLRFGPEATMSDVRIAYPLINDFLQNGAIGYIKGYVKGKKRANKNHKDNLRIYNSENIHEITEESNPQFGQGKFGTKVKYIKKMRANSQRKSRLKNKILTQ